MNQIPLTHRALSRTSVFTHRPAPRLTYSTTPGARPAPPPSTPKPPPPPPPSKVLPTLMLLGGGGAAGLGAYYYYDPNAEVFKQARSALGLESSSKQQNLAAEKVQQKKATQQQKAQAEQQPKKPQQVIRTESRSAEQQKAAAIPVPPPQKASPPPAAAATGPAVPPVPVPPTLAASAAAAAIATTAAAQSSSGSPPASKKQEESAPIGDSVPKHVLITAMRAQQEALAESQEAKIKTIQSEYDRRLSNATQVIEAERVVDLRAKYEKASASLQAIEQGIEARTTQNTRAKRLRALWAQVNALHARVNHPEYHDSTTTSIDKLRLISAIEIPDQFVSQMVGSLPCQPVHSLESLKQRFYDDVEPLAKSVTLIKEGEEFCIWKYALGKVFGSAIVRVNRKATDESESSPPSSSPVQITAHALDSARSALERSDLLSAAIAVNQLKGLPRQVASDWLSDARTLLETNQTLFVLMTYAASNNVF